ncbi:hypothetical protein D1197_09305 [Vibrio cholerae]|nr:hypothetical protein [Vibrio cholerae]
MKNGLIMQTYHYQLFAAMYQLSGLNIVCDDLIPNKYEMAFYSWRQKSNRKKNRSVIFYPKIYPITILK